MEWEKQVVEGWVKKEKESEKWKETGAVGAWRKKREWDAISFVEITPLYLALKLNSFYCIIFIINDLEILVLFLFYMIRINVRLCRRIQETRKMSAKQMVAVERVNIMNASNMKDLREWITNKDGNPTIPNPSTVNGMAGIIVVAETGRKTFNIHENDEPDIIGLFLCPIGQKVKFFE